MAAQQDPKTVKEVRRLRLEQLYVEAGSFAEIERLTGVVANLLSQYRLGKGMGDKVARKLEAGMGKITGWMDNLNYATSDEAIDAAEAASAMTILAKEDRDAVLRHIRLLVKNTPPGPHNPVGNAPLPRKPRGSTQ